MKSKDTNPLTTDIDLFLALTKMRKGERPPIYMAIPDDCNFNRLPDECVDLGIYDPPFGIKEKRFDKKHYTRDESFVIDGYIEAPEDYYKFSKDWISEAVRTLKPNGSMYIVSGWSNSDIIGRVIRESNLYLISKIIWNFPFERLIDAVLHYSRHQKSRHILSIYYPFCIELLVTSGTTSFLKLL